MKARSPLHDRTDSSLVDRLVANMKERHEGSISTATLARDIQQLEDEISFSEQRVATLKERCALAASAGAGLSATAHTQVFAELLSETEQELYRLYNAKQFLTAERLTNEGLPKEQIAAVLEMGDALFQKRPL